MANYHFLCFDKSRVKCKTSFASSESKKKKNLHGRQMDWDGVGNGGEIP